MVSLPRTKPNWSIIAVGREFAEFACGQVAELNLAVAYALEVADFVTDGTHHAADFTVLAFDKHKFCKSVFEVDVCGECNFFPGRGCLRHRPSAGRQIR